MTANPDADLLALSRQLEEARANAIRLGDEMMLLKGAPEFRKAIDLESEAWKRHAEIEDQIGKTPAATIDGIVIKLRIVAMTVPTTGAETVYETNIVSALADAERLAARVS